MSDDDAPLLKQGRLVDTSPTKEDAAGSVNRTATLEDKRKKKASGKQRGIKSVGRQDEPRAPGSDASPTPPASGRPNGSSTSSQAAQAGRADTTRGSTPVPGVDGPGDTTEDAENVGRGKVGSIQFETFLKFVEPYFRPLSEGDLTLLDVSDDVDPYVYMLPPLGPHYSEVWSEEDRRNAGLMGRAEDGPKPYTTPTNEGDSLPPPLCGYLTERIVSALLEEQLGVTVPALAGSGEDGLGEAIPAPDRTLAEGPDFNSLESRLRRELVFIGLLDDAEQPEPTKAEREDDEICFQLRHLQNQLRIQVALNSMRRARIHARAFAHLAYQEYEQLMEDVYKQVEVIYQKRYRPGKRGRKKEKLRPLADAERRLLERADKLAKRLAHIFPPGKFVTPQTSIFEGWEQTVNPNYDDLLSKVTYPSKTIVHPVLQVENPDPFATNFALASPSPLMASPVISAGSKPELSTASPGPTTWSPALSGRPSSDLHAVSALASPAMSGSAPGTPKAVGLSVVDKRKKVLPSGRPRSAKVVPPTAFGGGAYTYSPK